MKKFKLFPVKFTKRDDSGFGLPTVICLGATAALVLYGSAELLTHSMQKVAGERLIDVMRASAESGLDWAVEQLSNTGTKSNVDTGAAVSIPTDYLATVGGSSLSGTVTVSRIDAPATSYLYQSTLDSQATGNMTGGQVEWRVVTASVSNGARSKSVRVILKPSYSPYNVTSMGTTLVQGNPQPYFVHALKARGLISFSGNNASTDSYDSAQNVNPSGSQYHKGKSDGKGDVSSNQQVDVGNGNIGGKVQVTAGAGQGSASVGSNGSVAVDVESSGTGPSGYQQLTGDAATPEFIPDAPTAPATATSIPAITKSYTFAAAGDYVVPSISIAGNSSITFPSTGIVNIYVQGAGASISIAGNGFVTPSGYPANVRIWYSGSTDVQISGNGNVRGVIFAPNANVAFKGNGTFYGAAVGKTVSITGNGIFHYDEALGRSTQLTYIPPMVVKTTTVTTTYNFGQYKAVSWMEF